MKKISTCLLSLIILLSAMTACANQCKHQWSEATCTAPKTCQLCGKTSGKALPHTEINGICTICKEIVNPKKALIQHLKDNGANSDHDYDIWVHNSYNIKYSTDSNLIRFTSIEKYDEFIFTAMITLTQNGPQIMSMYEDSDARFYICGSIDPSTFQSTPHINQLELDSQYSEAASIFQEWMIDAVDDTLKVVSEYLASTDSGLNLSMFGFVGY